MSCEPIPQARTQTLEIGVGVRFYRYFADGGAGAVVVVRGIVFRNLDLGCHG